MTSDEHPALAGKVVLFTGAGRGIGEACARYAADRGALVAVNDIDGDLADQLATDISAHSGEAAAFPCDVSDWTAVDEMVSGVVSHFGRIDGLVNNAALFRMATLQDSTPELWNQMIGANVLGVAACGQRVAEEMVGQGSGSIVNITSGAQCGMDSMSIYGATKAAVASLTYTWAIELQSAGVRVNAISPRGATRMAAHGGGYIAKRFSTSAPVEPPPEVNAPAVAYLLSDLSEGITGQVVRVEGDTISLMTHPAISAPGIVNEAWDIDSVGRTFDADLRHRQLPPGVAVLRVAELLTTGSAGWKLPVGEVVAEV